MRASLVAFVRN